MVIGICGFIHWPRLNNGDLYYDVMWIFSD